MDSINYMVDYVKNLVNFKDFTYFDNVEFKAFDDMLVYLKNLFDFENVNLNVFDEIGDFFNGIINFQIYSLDIFKDVVSYFQGLLGYEDSKMDKNDIMLDTMYSSAFKATCYTKDEIPKNYLPYGLISDPKKYLDKVSEETNLEEWSVEIYDECLEYIKNFGGAESESEWQKDFIVFTNLQIAFYNNPNLIRENEEFELLSDYIRKQIRNLRSYVAKNAQLFLECLIFCLDDQKTLDDLSFKMIPELLASTGSEKATYRDSSRNNLKFLVSKCSKHFNQEILWLFFEHSKSLNTKISSSAGEFAAEYLINSNTDQLDLLDITKFIEYLEPGLSGKNVEVKRSLRRIVLSLPDLLSQDNFTLFASESKKNPFISQIIKKEFSTTL